jgi:hypothetical protein
MEKKKFFILVDVLAYKMATQSFISRLTFNVKYCLLHRKHWSTMFCVGRIL